MSLVKTLGIYNQKEINFTDLLNFISTNKDLIVNPYENDYFNKQNKFISMSLKKSKDINNSEYSDDLNDLQELDYGDIDNLNFLPEFSNSVLSKYKNVISRIGISKSFSEEETFLISILMCFIHNFNIKTIKEQKYYINYCFNNIFKDIYTDYLENKNIYFKKEKQKTKQVKVIDFNKLTEELYTYLISYFHINIFVIDIEKDNIYFKTDKDISINKKTIFMLKYKDRYETLFINGRKYSVAPNKLINELIEVLNLDFENEDNLKNYLELNQKVIDKKFNGISYTDKLILNKQKKIIMNTVKKQGGDYKEIKNEKEKLDIYEEKEDNLHIRETEDNCVKENVSISSDEDESCEILDDEVDTVKTNRNNFTQDGSEIFIKKEMKEYDEKSLQKLKLQQIQAIAERNNIKLKKEGKSGKSINKTKSELIEEILEK